MTSAIPAPDRPALGVIAGGGGVPIIVAKAAEAAGRPVVLFGIVGEADLDIEAFHHHWLRWGEIGRLFDLMARERVGEVVICGAVNRPDFSAIRVDLGAVLSLPKILSLMVGGDDSVLKNVVRFLEDRSYRVIGAHQVAPELVGGSGNLGRIKPSGDAEADIAKGVEASLTLGRLDIGQAAVAISGRVVAVEGIEGTDELLQRVADLRKRGAPQGGAPVWRAGEGGQASAGFARRSADHRPAHR